jgi:hypothetical protein
MLGMHTREFERQLRAFESQLSSRFKTQFEVGVSFFRRISDVIDEKMNTIPPKSNFEWATTFLFYRCYKLYWTILILCQKGFGPEAGIVLRSLMEHTINMEWIAKEDSDHRAQLFLDYFHVARKKLYDNYDKHGVLSNLSDAEKELMESREEIERRYTEVRANYPKEMYWAPKTIKSRAREVGARYDWDFYYWHLSFLAHPNAASQFEFLLRGEPKDALVIGPSYSMIHDVVHLSCKYLMLAVNRWNLVFKLGLEEMLLDLARKLLDISHIREDQHDDVED